MRPNPISISTYIVFDKNKHEATTKEKNGKVELDVIQVSFLTFDGSSQAKQNQSIEKEKPSFSNQETEIMVFNSKYYFRGLF